MGQCPCPTCMTAQNPCPTCTVSIVLATVITAIITALLAIAIFVLVEIVVHKHTRKVRIRTSAGGEEQEKEKCGY